MLRLQARRRPAVQELKHWTRHQLTDLFYFAHGWMDFRAQFARWVDSKGLVLRFHFDFFPSACLQTFRPGARGAPVRRLADLLPLVWLCWRYQAVQLGLLMACRSALTLARLALAPPTWPSAGSQLMQVIRLARWLTAQAVGVMWATRLKIQRKFVRREQTKKERVQAMAMAMAMAQVKVKVNLNSSPNSSPVRLAGPGYRYGQIEMPAVR